MFSHHSHQMSQRSKVSKIAFLLVFSSLWSNVSKVKSLKDRLFVGQVMFSHHSDQMSQRSTVSKIALWRYFLILSVIVIVFVFVFAFVFVIHVGHLVNPHVDHPQQFSKVLVWYVRLEGSESSTVSQSVSKVGLELLGQLKIMSAINISWLCEVFQKCNWGGRNKEEVLLE